MTTNIELLASKTVENIDILVISKPNYTIPFLMHRLKF